MRKLLLRTSTIVFVFMLVVLACQKERLNDTANENDATTMSVSEAKNFYDSNKQPDMVLKDGKVGESRKMGIKPDWSNGTTSKNDDIEVVEVGLLVQGGFGFADKSVYDEWNANKQNGLKNSLTRMVFTKNKKSGKIEQFLMSIIGDKEYHDNKESRLKENAYLKREKHFSGHIFYHDPAGNYANGWKYEKGKLVATTTQTSGDVLQTNLKMATTCIPTTVYTRWEVATEWFQHGKYIYTTYSYYTTLDFIECPTYFTGSGGFINEIPIASGGGGTPGGYIPPPTVTPVPCTCVNTCPVCGKCLDMSLLKSAGVDACAICTCPTVPEITETQAFKDNIKVQCIYSNLKGTMAKSYNPIVTNFLVNFTDGVTSNPGDVYFDIGPIKANYGTVTYGSCLPDIESDKFYVRLNEECINNRSSIEIAHTLIHEILHAQLGHNIGTNTNSFIDLYKQYIVTNGRGESYSSDHQIMLDFYVPAMTRFLKTYDLQNGFSEIDKYYRSLALSGLKEVGSINLTTEEMNDIWEAEAYFRSRGLNCQ